MFSRSKVASFDVDCLKLLKDFLEGKEIKGGAVGNKLKEKENAS